MHIKFVARCNRSSQKGKGWRHESLLFILLCKARWPMKGQSGGLRTLRAAEYPFLGVQTRTNTDKSIINARLHTKAAQREDERDEHSDGEKC